MIGSDRAIGLRLHGEAVATLVEHGKASEGSNFSLYFESAYVDRVVRPVLTLRARDWRLDRIRKFQGRLPPFLTNLLPERDGALRRRVLAAGGLDPGDEFGLLAFVGQDMSGAITAETVSAALPSGRTIAEEETAATSLLSTTAERLRWSLGGIQLKFSVDRTDRLCLPVKGKRGTWILKIPDRTRLDLPRAEYAAMEWARATGFEVPMLEIVDPREVEGLPPDVSDGISEALLVRRFDRLNDYTAVHMEEFGSVLGVHPEDKYPDNPSPHRHNVVALARLVKQLAGPVAMRVFLERVFFDVLVGNGDGHLKNWAFIFPDRRTPMLAPVFDVVPTILYGMPSELSLSLTSERAFGAVDVGRIRQLATKLAESPEEILTLAREMVQRAMATFESSMMLAGLDASRVEVLRLHLQRLPLTHLADG